MKHEDDSQCTVDAVTQLCTGCGADHSRTCPDCGKRAYHTATCFLWAPPESFIGEPFVQLPYITFPGWLKALGFKDSSWRNDGAGSATFEIDADTEIICWVSTENPANRDGPQDRFAIYTADKHEQLPAKTIYEGDDYREAYRAILTFREELGKRP